MVAPFVPLGYKLVVAERIVSLMELIQHISFIAGVLIEPINLDILVVIPVDILNILVVPTRYS